MPMTDRLAELLDRWRHGPEFRAAILRGDQALEEVVRLRADLEARSESVALLAEFVRTAKVRCSRCGDLSWHWSTVPVAGPGGKTFLRAICDGCQRTIMAAEKSRAEAAKKAEAGVAVEVAAPAGSTLEG